MSAWTKGEVRQISARGGEANRVAALTQVESMRWQIESALSGGTLLRVGAEQLNKRNIASPGGGRWHAPSLLKAARRLGLRAA